MAGHVGIVLQASDGSYGFVVSDEAGHSALYLGFASNLEADTASRQVQSVLVAATRCRRLRPTDFTAPGPRPGPRRRSGPR
jgi:hypothetical protein